MKRSKKSVYLAIGLVNLALFLWGLVSLIRDSRNDRQERKAGLAHAAEPPAPVQEYRRNPTPTDIASWEMAFTSLDLDEV